MKNLLIFASLFGAITNAAPLSITGNGSSVYFQENPSSDLAVRSLGQTFVLPVGDSVLTDFAFTFMPGTDASFNYRAFVFAWDSPTQRAVGPALYASDSRTGVQAPSFSGLSVELNPGTAYIALLTTQGVLNDGYSNGLLVHNSGNVYAGGGAFQQTASPSNGSTGTGSWNSNSWTNIWGGEGTDFQFAANFANDDVVSGAATPEPGTSALMLLGGLTMLGMRRFITKRHIN